MTEQEEAELREQLESRFVEVTADLAAVDAPATNDRGEDPSIKILRKYAQEGREDAQQALAELGISPESNAQAAARGGGGSFDGYLYANSAAGNADVRDVRLVDSPEKGEAVRLFDPRDDDGMLEANSAGAEHVRIVDLHEDPERAVDADPIYPSDYEAGGAGTFENFQKRPEHSVVPVNPEELP